MESNILDRSREFWGLLAVSVEGGEGVKLPIHGIRDGLLVAVEF